MDYMYITSPRWTVTQISSFMAALIDVHVSKKAFMRIEQFYVFWTTFELRVKIFRVQKGSVGFAIDRFKAAVLMFIFVLVCRSLLRGTFTWLFSRMFLVIFTDKKYSKIVLNCKQFERLTQSFNSHF